MKQTLKEAVSEYIEKHVSRNENASFSAAFKAGAEWQKKQRIELFVSTFGKSPWISVEERYPSFDKDNHKNYLVRVSTGSIMPSIYYATSPLVLRNRFGIEMDWTKVTHWMPIPSFDEILEMNKDVLQRMKEK